MKQICIRKLHLEMEYLNLETIKGLDTLERETERQRYKDRYKKKNKETDTFKI